MGEKKLNNIAKARKAQGKTQAWVALELGVSRPTYRRIEAGEKELTVGQARKLAGILETGMDELLTVAEGTAEFAGAVGMIEKYKQMATAMIKYGADEDGDITKVKLARLLYLTDFGWYGEAGVAMSGATYWKMARGPVADVYALAMDELEDDGVVVRERAGAATKFSLVEDNIVTRKLSDDELEMIQRVAWAWKGRTTEEIVKHCASQEMWKMSQEGRVIEYSLAMEGVIEPGS